IVTLNAKETCAAAAAAAESVESAVSRYNEHRKDASLAHAYLSGMYGNSIGKISAILTTAGVDGMYLSTRDCCALHLPAYPPSTGIIDATGAGDVVVACLASELVSYTPTCDRALLTALPQIARRAAVGAGLAVGKRGTTPINSAEWQQALRE